MIEMKYDRNIYDNNKYVLHGMMRYENTDVKTIRVNIAEVLDCENHPITEMLCCLNELVRDTDGDLDILNRRNANGDNVLLVEALDLYGDELYKRSSAGREAPLTKRYPYGIYEDGLKKDMDMVNKVDHKKFFLNVMAMYAAIATKEMWAVSTEGHVFEIISCGTSTLIGDLHE